MKEQEQSAGITRRLSRTFSFSLQKSKDDRTIDELNPKEEGDTKRLAELLMAGEDISLRLLMLANTTSTLSRAISLMGNLREKKTSPSSQMTFCDRIAANPDEFYDKNLQDQKELMNIVLQSETNYLLLEKSTGKDCEHSKCHAYVISWFAVRFNSPDTLQKLLTVYSPSEEQLEKLTELAESSDIKQSSRPLSPMFDFARKSSFSLSASSLTRSASSGAGELAESPKKTALAPYSSAEREAGSSSPRKSVFFNSPKSLLTSSTAKSVIDILREQNVKSRGATS